MCKNHAMSIAYDDMVERLKFSLPDRLSKALDVSGVSSNEMAAELGVSRNTISNYINGRTPAKRSVLLQWAVKTGVPYAWIENGELPESSKPDPSDYMASLSVARSNVIYARFAAA